MIAHKLVTLLVLLSEELCEHGPVGPEEDQVEAQEVPDASAHLPSRARQRLH